MTAFAVCSRGDKLFLRLVSFAAGTSPALPSLLSPKKPRTVMLRYLRQRTDFLDLVYCSLHIPVLRKRKTGWQKIKMDVKMEVEQRKQETVGDSLHFSCPISITAW